MANPTGERASVPAFVALREELLQLHAPANLAQACRLAAADEVRHARTMRQFARCAGATCGEGFPKPGPVSRSLFDMALENAVEGCVYETFAALVAMHQTRHAARADIRAAMADIAADETGHGELAWAIHRWACEQLPAEQVAHLERAMRHAATEMIRSFDDRQLSDATRRTLGLPDAARSRAMATAVREQLWS